MATKLSIETREGFVEAVERIRALTAMLSEDFGELPRNITGGDIENATGYVAEMRSLLAAMKRYW